MNTHHAFAPKEFAVTFWGVRGTIATPDAEMSRYGGHTSCVQVQCGDVTFALDAGSGIVPMGMQNFKHMHLLLSHTHIDHIIGLCCMQKIFHAEFKADIWAGHLLPDMHIEEALRRLISPPIFPVPLEALESQIAFHDFYAGNTLHHEDFDAAGIEVHTLHLHHPDRATAYRIEYQGHSVCYVTDVEHLRGGLDDKIIQFISAADMFIYDSTYDDQEFERYQGWGHSTWQQAIRLGEAACVKHIMMFHHNPTATDATLDARTKAAKTLTHIRTSFAKQGTRHVLNAQATQGAKRGNG
jgi:phosphoribosyl 1,2-cyclic phosphodiesterase